jgi:hypothetical protein
LFAAVAKAFFIAVAYGSAYTRREAASPVGVSTPRSSIATELSGCD